MEKKIVLSSDLGADVNCIKNARLAIMGIAALMIMIFHGTISMNNSVVQTFIRTGYLGVDIFMFMSGFSMCYSFKNSCGSNSIIFLKKRLAKILPSFIPFAVIWMISYFSSNFPGVYELKAAMYTKEFWLTLISFKWFIPCILVCYFLTPMIDKYFNHFGYKNNILYMSVIGIILVSFLFLGSSIALMILIRIPEYIIGYYYANSQNKKSSLSIRIIIVALQFPLFYILMNSYSHVFLMDHGLYWYPAIFTVSSMVLCLSKIGFEKAKVLKFCGKHSLELYLWHETVLYLTQAFFYRRNIEFDKYNIIINSLSIVLTCFFSYLYAHMIRLSMNLYKKVIKCRLGEEAIPKD